MLCECAFSSMYSHVVHDLLMTEQSMSRHPAVLLAMSLFSCSAFPSMCFQLILFLRPGTFDLEQLAKHAALMLHATFTHCPELEMLFFCGCVRRALMLLYQQCRKSTPVTSMQQACVISCADVAYKLVRFFCLTTLGYVSVIIGSPRMQHG